VPSKYPLFDVSKLRLRSLGERRHDLDVSSILALKPAETVLPELEDAAAAIKESKRRGSAVVLMMGAHVIRSGVQRYLIDLMERGWLTCLAGNGACAIHDYEFALVGATTESVGTYIRDGRFGLWKETSGLNKLAVEATSSGQGLGETIGQAIENSDFPSKDISLFASAFRLGVPFTVHAGIGYDIVCEHPNYDGGAWGAASHTDFLIFASVAQRLGGGTVINMGSAVMGPEVYLKALAMARNVAVAEGAAVDGITTVVTDLRDLGDTGREAPKASSEYFFRPFKTMLVRTVAGNGRGIYARIAHAEAIPQLWTALTRGDGHAL
jgi:hypothetical protein